MTPESVPDPILWRCASRFHDWSQGYARTLIEAWVEDGLIGAPARFEVDDIARACAGVEAAGVPGLVLDAFDQRQRELSAGVGGETPHPWWLTVHLPRYDAKLGRNIGYAMVNLYLTREACAGAARSARLLDRFEALHRPEVCEFAAIHPERHSETLKIEAYVPALTFGPMFAGVFWANFLGPGHVERFDRAAIDALSVYRRRWFGDDGVFFAVSDDVSTADTRPAEAALIAMTRTLRAGLRE